MLSYVICLIFIILVFASQLSGCSDHRSKPEASFQPAFDSRNFQQGTVYTVLEGGSEIRIKVYRGGSLAALGHNHIISSSHITGKVFRHPDIRQSGFYLHLPVSHFVVDRTDYRQEAGNEFNSIPSEKDIIATFSNMLGERVLDAAHFPEIGIASIAIRPEQTLFRLTLRLTVRGFNHDVTTTANIKYDNQQLVAEGAFQLKQTDLNLTPFSILFGAITIQDSLNISYHIVASRE